MFGTLNAPAFAEGQRQIEGLKSGIDETKCRWVKFHNHRFYLLPVVSRFEKLVATFDEDGTPILRRESAHPELHKYIDGWLEAFASPDKVVAVENEGQWELQPEVWTALMSLARALLLTNYDFDTQSLAAVLTVSPREFAVLCKVITDHVMQG